MSTFLFAQCFLHILMSPVRKTQPIKFTPGQGTVIVTHHYLIFNLLHQEMNFSTVIAKLEKARL